ncbi:phosphotransferase [Terrimonas sp. NA20]|uniref:Phosphotransferase n=1 Tax=Terrimonas ginsenosidimutans TaxID=2908004 RepID=A0ABS9KNN6_9BACT|nr:RNase adapter RapZ [Terrimonas ginsenosidimutans]MCG2613930.1 phosphotransferase [Terrimonas ginsenosidimutans]
MQALLDSIKELYTKWKGVAPESVDVLPQSGSERRYFRLYGDGRSVIGTYGANIPENEAFIYFSRQFKPKGLAVPEILAISEDGTFYLQEDFGDVSLLNRLEAEGFAQPVYDLFKRSLDELATLQVKGDEGLDYDRTLTNKEFGKQAIMADLLYFKYYFLDALRKPYDKQKLINDFEALSNYLTHTEYKYFMFRDFQSRNIMVKKDGSVHFIDYQGGMKGAPQYDVASMLWQARANLTAEWKDKLLEEYMDTFETLIPSGSLDRIVFRSQYNGYVLIRLLQVLGAYGFRGLFERKAQFLTAIPLGLRNLKEFFENQSLGISVPEFKKVLDLCVSDEIIQMFTPIQATDDTPLVVKIKSFSYRNGIPADDSGNGGGFVFDCRGILNPGRFESMKYQTGRDKEVKDFLEQQTKMQEFLDSSFDIVDISVEDYIKRGFESLSVSFGCTGGQHRSVYAADALARHLRNKFKVNIELQHVVQDAKNWVNQKPA